MGECEQRASADPVICRNDRGEPFYCDPSRVEAAPDRLFRNDGGRFTDVTAEAGIVDPDGRGLGVVAADVDLDGQVDLYVGNDGTANFLFQNLGGFRFREVGLVVSRDAARRFARSRRPVRDGDAARRPDARRSRRAEVEEQYR